MYKVGRSLLKYRRLEKGWTQAYLAERAGNTRQEVNDHETGRKGHGLVATYNYARALGCRMEDLHEWVIVDNSKRGYEAGDNE